MWRERGLLPLGILWAVSVLALGCAESNPRADSPVDLAPAAAPPPSSSGPNQLDVNMSFAEDESEPEDEEQSRSRYAPPPTKTYSPANKMSAAEKPEE